MMSVTFDDTLAAHIKSSQTCVEFLLIQPFREQKAKTVCTLEQYVFHIVSRFRKYKRVLFTAHDAKKIFLFWTSALKLHFCPVFHKGPRLVAETQLTVPRLAADE